MSTTARYRTSGTLQKASPTDTACGHAVLGQARPDDRCRPAKGSAAAHRQLASGRLQEAQRAPVHHRSRAAGGASATGWPFREAVAPVQHRQASCGLQVRSGTQSVSAACLVPATDPRAACRSDPDSDLLYVLDGACTTFSLQDREAGVPVPPCIRNAGGDTVVCMLESCEACYWFSTVRRALCCCRRCCWRLRTEATP